MAKAPAGRRPPERRPPERRPPDFLSLLQGGHAKVLDLFQACDGMPAESATPASDAPAARLCEELVMRLRRERDLFHPPLPAGSVMPVATAGGPAAVASGSDDGRPWQLLPARRAGLDLRLRTTAPQTQAAVGPPP